MSNNLQNLWPCLHDPTSRRLLKRGTPLVLFQYFWIHIGRWSLLKSIYNVLKVPRSQNHFHFTFPKANFLSIEFFHTFSSFAFKIWHLLLKKWICTLKIHKSSLTALKWIDMLSKCYRSSQIIQWPHNHLIKKFVTTNKGFCSQLSHRIFKYIKLYWSE